jgi:nicotinate phosphoribosyltransferase
MDILKDGRRVYELPTIDTMRRCREADLAQLDPGVKRLMNPHIYHVSLSQRLWALKQQLISAARPNLPVEPA